MCGRYASSRSPEDLVEEFEVLDPRLERAVIEPSWNVAPTDPVFPGDAFFRNPIS